MKRERWRLASDAIGAIERDVWIPETPDEEPEALHRMLSVGAHHPDRQIIEDVEEMRGLIDAGLIGMGFPPSDVRLATRKGEPPRIIEAPDEIRAGEGFAWSWAWIEKNAEPLSEAYWLGKMSFSLMVIEHSLKKNDMMTVFRHAMKLGAYQTEIDVRRIALRYAHVGKKQVAAGDEGRAIRRAGSFKALHGAAAQERAAALHAEKPGRTWAKIRDLLAQEFGVSAETIKKAVRNPKKNG